jgi:hypothetical protein
MFPGRKKQPIVRTHRLSDLPHHHANISFQPSLAGCAFEHLTGEISLLCRMLLTGWVLLLTVTDAAARHPLEPFDTSSPRATLQSYLELSDQLGLRFLEYRDAQVVLRRQHSKRQIFFEWASQPKRADLDKKGLRSSPGHSLRAVGEIVDSLHSHLSNSA